jgi:hypothetical protein
MELNFDNLSYEGRWFEFGDGRLKIRTYPASKQNFVIKDGNIVFLGEQNLDKFKHCLMDWDNYVKAGTKEKIVLNDEVKKKVYDFRLGLVVIDGKEMVISDFVMLKADELFKEMVEAEKN